MSYRTVSNAWTWRTARIENLALFRVNSQSHMTSNFKLSIIRDEVNLIHYVIMKATIEYI